MIVAVVPLNVALVGTSAIVTVPVMLVASGVNFVVVTVPVGAFAVPAKSALRAAAEPLNDAVG